LLKKRLYFVINSKHRDIFLRKKSRYEIKSKVSKKNSVLAKDFLKKKKMLIYCVSEL